MEKYIDAHKLLVEIDRQKIGYNTDGEHAAEYNTCRKILDIIDSLQQEQQEVILLKKDTEDIFAREYAIYSLPPFVVESIAYGTQLIDFIYKTAHHFYERGFRRAAEMYDEIEYNRQRAEED